MIAVQQHAEEACVHARTYVCEVSMQPSWAIALAVLIALFIIAIVCRYMVLKQDEEDVARQEEEAQRKLYPRDR